MGPTTPPTAPDRDAPPPDPAGAFDPSGPGPGSTPLPRWVSVIGWLAVLVFAGAAVAALLPIDNPGVQSCGVPAAFLIDGRPDVYPDANAQVRRADGRIDTLDKDQIARAFDDRCSERVSHRMVPVAMAVTVATVLGMVALFGTAARWWRRSAPVDHTIVTA